MVQTKHQGIVQIKSGVRPQKAASTFPYPSTRNDNVA